MKFVRTLIVLSLVAGPAFAAGIGQLSQSPTFATLIMTPEPIGGMTGDNRGNLYFGTRNTLSVCPVYRINIDVPSLLVVGFLPLPCSTLGLAFDHSGTLYVTNLDKIFRLVPDATVPPVASLFAVGVPGADGVAFDRDNNLWVSDGGAGKGRVWRIGLDGLPVEMFRIPPLTNSSQVGRTVVPWPNTPAGAAETIVSSGLAFDAHGDLIVADTSRGALWKVKLDSHGNVLSPMGCDSTLASADDTLCPENVLVQHPLREGAGGVALDRAGNIWVDASERNAIVIVDESARSVREIFRNAPDPVTGLRNGGPLEFPTSPVLSANRFCTTNSDLNRRDNAPNIAGELGDSSPLLGKISCTN
jgi:sugar lactone lactonase YvrE